jgi:hypothetical protein
MDKSRRDGGGADPVDAMGSRFRAQAWLSVGPDLASYPENNGRKMCIGPF